MRRGFVVRVAVIAMGCGAFDIRQPGGMPIYGPGVAAWWVGDLQVC